MRRLVLLLLLSFATPAQAVTLSVYRNGALQGSFGYADLGCSGDPDKFFGCVGGPLSLSTVHLDSWHMNFVVRGTILGTIAVHNPLKTTEHYTLILTLPVAPALPASITGGSISGSLTSISGPSGATVSTFPGSSFYTALIDGSPWQTLYDHPTSFSVGSGSTDIHHVAFGAPIPSLPGPAVLSTIGIALDFRLTSQDAVSFTSNFFVSVPEPRLALLLVPALLALALRRSR
jgi:hypothetical protein